MAPSGRVCKGDERLIIPSLSKCDGDDVEQAPLGLMTREHGILGKIVENDKKVPGILSELCPTRQSRSIQFGRGTESPN